MKIYYLLLLLLIFNSCKKEKNQNNVESSEFDFSIEGTVEDGEGIELALYIPSVGMDKRLKSKIKNGKFHFKGKTNSIESAKIIFEEDMNRSSNYWSLPVFLEPTNIHFNFTVFGDSLNRRTKNNLIIEPSNSKYLHDTEEIVFREYSSLPPYKNDIEKDSLYQYVYPEIKERILKTLDSLFSNKNYDATALFVLNRLIEVNRPPFEYEKISKSEKKELNYLFERIDPTLSNTPDYKEFENKIKNIIGSNTPIVFKDFTLPDIKGKNLKLSQIIKDNKYTVLDFWWSGCSPCRKFNKETTIEQQQKLKENGIEIISINVDESRKTWEESSENDSISWINLFAGGKSEIALEYKIQYYPTKIIFDNHFNVVDFEFYRAEQLINLLDE